MREISFQTIKRIIELHLKGYVRDVIARKVGVSTGAVSNVINLLPESLEDLRTLGVELRKSGKSLHEALECTNLCRQLKEMNVELDQLEGYVKAMRRFSRKARYEPKQVVQAEIRLSNLEDESGKSFQEAIKEFETKIKETQRLDGKMLKTQEVIEEKEKERRQKLRLNRVTEKDIRHVKELQQKLARRRISLADVESLEKYLVNMKETGMNPRNFTRFTREFGSIKGRLTYLENQKKEKILELAGLKKEIKDAKIENSKLENRISELRKEEKVRIGRLEKLNEVEIELKLRHKTINASIAKMLGVRAHVKEINEALTCKEMKLRDLEDKIKGRDEVLEEKQLKINELEKRELTLTREVEDLLNIRDYTLEHKGAISRLKEQKTSLEKEVEEKRLRVAFSDVITDFLSRLPNYDFNMLCTVVEEVKRIREGKNITSKPLLFQLEEGIRKQLLDLVAKIAFKEVWDWKEKYRKGKIELEGKLQLKEDELTSVRKEREFLQNMKVYIEMEPRSLKDLEEWRKSVCEEEIEKRANEKFNKEAARVYGLADWVHQKAKAHISRGS